jgi:hypothetical protein
MKYLLILILLVFTGCNNVQDKLRNSVQTENAKHIRNNYKALVELLLEYKVKLDKRNPKAYSSQLNNLLRKNINENTDEINLYVNNSIPLKHYQDYLNYAFDKNTDVVYRNDYLSIGMYKMFYESYNMDSKYKMTALSYDIDKLQKAYKNLQIIQWKIKFDKDSKNSFLFLTWQNNWQIELLKKLTKEKIENIKLSDLKYIKSKKESIFDPSNNSYEVITSKMLLYYEHTLRLLNAEPEALGIETIMSILFLI